MEEDIWGNVVDASVRGIVVVGLFELYSGSSFPEGVLLGLGYVAQRVCVDV